MKLSDRVRKVAALEQAPVNAVNAQPKKTRSGSKHPPGYMTEYMRKRRAKK